MYKWVISSLKQNKKTVSEIINILLSNRGYKTNKQIDNFMNPRLSDINPENAEIDIKELKKAKIRIGKAIKNQESIVVYSDYDADGVCAGAIIWETLNKMGANIMPYIPERIKEGYGLSKIGIENIKTQFDPGLLITVDHGITANDHIEQIKKDGIDSIIIDHHVKSKKLPDADAIIHTTKLSSGGIALIFSNYLCGTGFEYLELAAISTVSDLIPLKNINRNIVKFGLDQLNKTQRLGLNFLIKKSGLEKGKIGAYEISHILAPRINAMGRLSHALDALRLLCTRDVVRADKLADLLCRTNKDRQILTRESFLHAKDIILKQSDDMKKKGIIPSKLIFISNSSYREGVIGLIAGKLVDEHKIPSIVVSEGDVYCKASARSVKGLDIIQLIRKADDLIIDAGGHPMAAGFTFLKKNMEKLKKRLTNLVEQNLKDNKTLKTIDIDLILNLSDISYQLFEKLQILEPFGVGNPEPIFALLKLKPLSFSQVGKDKRHLKLMITNDWEEHTTRDGYKTVITDESYSAIGFGMGDLSEKFLKGTRIDMAFTIIRDDWNGGNKLQLRIKDVNI
jgi:single-stranded-DNA-specific exonuclease